MAVVEHDGAPLIISAGNDGALRSWRLDGSPGELTVDDAHRGSTALMVVEHAGAPLIISAAVNGALRSWRVGPDAWTRLGGPLAAQLEVRRLSLVSLELEVLVPTAVSAVPAALGFVRYAFRKLWTFPIQLKIDTAKKRAELIEAERELERLIAHFRSAAFWHAAACRGAAPIRSDTSWMCGLRLVLEQLRPQVGGLRPSGAARPGYSAAIGRIALRWQAYRP